MKKTEVKQSKKYPTPNVILNFKIKKMLKTWKKMAKKSKHRLNIMKEWAYTEEGYIKDLYLIIDQIQKPLQEKKLINDEEDRLLFPNINSIIKLSEEMLNQIKNIIKNWHPHKTMIGETLINFHKYFIIYRDYCNSFMRGQQIIKQVRKHPEAQKIQSKLMMDFESYIIKPVQRPPKYQLLLRQYQKSLNPKHKDYQNLTIAIEKYHQVNEENNQSMDLQIRSKMMIKLDEKYGDIISSSRQFIFDETAHFMDHRIKLYIFNDLVLAVKMVSQEVEGEEKKIFLDEDSYVQASMDGKYFINKLFICGKEENIHLNFHNIATRDRVHEILQKIIHEIYRKATKRKSLMTNFFEKKKLHQKVKVTQIEELRNQKLFSELQLKLRVTVVGVEKRPISHLSTDTVYILKIKVPYPGNVFQYSYVSFEELVQYEKELRKRFRNMFLPNLDQKPETMNYYDIKKNKTKIIEYRQIFIERFVNYLLRSPNLIKILDQIANRLKINYQLWKFATHGNQECNCNICSASNRQTLTIKALEGRKSSIKSFIEERLSTQSSIFRQEMSGTFCIFNSFLMSSQIALAETEELSTLERRLTWLDCKMGRIDYSIMPKEENRNYKIKVVMPTVKEDKSVPIGISKNTTVQEVVEDVAVYFKVNTLRDFGLFLDYQGFPRLLDRDQKIYDVLSDIGYDFEETKTNDNGFWKKVTNIKKWGEEIITGKKSNLYMKKYLFLNIDLELKACLENPERYELLVDEIFLRYKQEILLLGVNDARKLAALFYIINNHEKLGSISATNFQLSKVKPLLSESKWQILENSLHLEKGIYTAISSYQENAKKWGLKIESLYKQVINLVYEYIGWNSLLVQVVNYDPASLPGNTANLLLGVNRQNLTVVRPKQLAPLLQIPLLDLDYKVTAFSIFIETEEKTLRFDGRMMYDIKKMIEIYRTLGEKFEKQD